MGWILFPVGIGWKDVARTIHTGTFECRNPRCKGKKSSGRQQFKVRQHRNWVVAFYIPVLPLNKLGASVRCASCKSYFSLDALPEEELQRLATGVSISPSTLEQADVVESPPVGVQEASPPGAMFTPRPCPHCNTHMPRDASVCPSCQRESTPWRFEHGVWWTKGPQDRWYWLHEETREWMEFRSEPAGHADSTAGHVQGPSERAAVLDRSLAETGDPVAAGPASVDRGQADEAPDLRPLIKNSTASLPAFVMVDDVTRPGLNEELDVQWSDMGWLQPSEGEEILGRWLCLRVMCHVGVGETDGLPGALTSDSSLLSPVLFDGAGPLFLTSRRIVGWIGHGRTIFGPVGPREGLLYTLPLAVIEQLDVTRKEGWGGTKETGVIVWSDEGGSLFADLDRAVDESRRARSSSRMEAARAIVAAVAAVQRATATTEQAAILDRALAGDWRAGEDDDLEIALAPASDTSPESDTRDGASSEDPRSESPPEEARAETSRVDSDVDDADRPIDGAAWSCLACGVSNVEEHRFCTKCGTERGGTPASAETADDADVEVSVVPGCQECDCIVVPAPEDRFCRRCGHPVEAHVAAATVLSEPAVASAVVEVSTVESADDDMDAGSDEAADDAAEMVATVEPAVCWSCDRPVPHGSSECSHCGVSLDQSWEKSARVQVPVGAGAVAEGFGEALGELPSDDSEQDQVPLVDVEAVRPGHFAPSLRTAEPRVGGWGVAVFLLGVVGGFIGWLTLRPSDPRRANHVLKWGAIWSAFFFVVTPIVTYLVLFAALKSFSDSYESFDSSTDYEQTTDYGVTDTDLYTTDASATTDTYTTTETDPYSTTPTATAILGTPVVERQFAISSSDGYTGDLTVTVYDVSHASDFPPLPLTYRNTIASCDFDPTTDAVIPVSFRFQNTSPAGFSATPLTVSLHVDQDYSIANPLAYAGDVRYSDSDACLDPLAQGGFNVYSAHWATATGSASDDFYLVLHDYYSPSSPEGDEARLTRLSLSASVGFGPSGSQSLAGADELIPVSDGRASSSSSSSTSSPPPPAATSTKRRTTLTLTEVMIAPAPPYRCASPFARDHDERMELELRYASGATAKWVSTDPSDTSDNFVFCGGSVTYDLPGYAAAPILFQENGQVARIVSVSGVLGADRDEGAPGRRVALAVSYDGERICDVGTDSAGHARRFTCRGFPSAGSLAGLELRLDVAGDRRQGVFAGIAELEATVEEG